MTLAVLEAGAPPAALIERFGTYPDMMARMLGFGTLPSYDVAAGRLPEPAAHTAYIITGSPAGVYEDLPWIPLLLEFLRAAKGKAKLVGICFGHQAMAQAFGGQVEKAAAGWGIGLHEYAVTRREPWMDDALAVAIPASHQDQVMVQPPHADIIMASGFTPIAGLAWRDQPAISFQCHPELEPVFVKALIESRRERLPDPDRAIASLDGFNDNARMGRWIGRFLGLAPPGPSS